VTWWRTEGDGVVLSLRVVPGARRSEVVDAGGEQLKVRIAAPAIEGKANAEVQRFVAELFGVRRSTVALRRGDRSRDKVVHVAGIREPPPEMLRI
jgi:uncharacterized protein (TIGR00251 family)